MPHVRARRGGDLLDPLLARLRLAVAVRVHERGLAGGLRGRALHLAEPADEALVRVAVSARGRGAPRGRERREGREDKHEEPRDPHRGRRRRAGTATSRALDLTCESHDGDNEMSSVVGSVLVAVVAKWRKTFGFRTRRRRLGDALLPFFTQTPHDAMPSHAK